MDPTPFQPGPLAAPGSDNHGHLPCPISFRCAYPSTKTTTNTWAASSSFCVRGEDRQSRDLRIFGGTVEDVDGTTSDELRGSMLDVVFVLFNGVDYEDDMDVVKT